MLSLQMIQRFSLFFAVSYNLGYFPFGWDKKRSRLLNINPTSWQYKLWLFHNFMLLLKNMYLVAQVYNLGFVQNNLSKVVFENLFLFTYTAGMVANFLFWKKRKQFPLLFWRSIDFSASAKERLLSSNKSRYPIEGVDPLVGRFNSAIMVVIVFTVCIFLLSMTTPTIEPFFANWMFPNANLYPPLVLVLGVFEAHIMAFAWIANTVIVLLFLNYSALIKFWCDNLLAKDESKGRNNFKKYFNTYRQLQLIEQLFNECFAQQAQNAFMCAFPNQVSVNYGTLKLYGELPLVTWLCCPYLTIVGASNICAMQDTLATFYESSAAAIDTWKYVDRFAENKSGLSAKEVRIIRSVIRSCNPLKAKYGSFKKVEKDQGIEWVDSMIDMTVTVLLWN